MEWIKNCQMCNDGIVIGVNKYKKDGESERAACRHMAEDAAKEYPDLAEEFGWDRIRQRYKRHGKGWDSNAAKKRSGTLRPTNQQQSVPTTTNNMVVFPDSKEDESPFKMPENALSIVMDATIELYTCIGILNTKHPNWMEEDMPAWAKKYPVAIQEVIDRLTKIKGHLDERFPTYTGGDPNVIEIKSRR